MLGDPLLPQPLDRFADAAVKDASDATRARLRDAYNDALDAIGSHGLELLRAWPAIATSATDDQYVYTVRGREIRGDNYAETLSHNHVPKLAVPRYRDWGEVLTFLMKENLPGYFPYTAGVYPYRREEEDPTRMFAGEGDPFRTNKRFHLLSKDLPAKRLSTAFDSVTLYGFDPDERPEDPAARDRRRAERPRIGAERRHVQRHEQSEDAEHAERRAAFVLAGPIIELLGVVAVAGALLAVSPCRAAELGSV
jgi:methylmalonyl-CoA mutase